MQKILIFSLILILNFTAFGQTKTFYDSVLGSECWGCFVRLNIESKSFSGPVVVENIELFHYLKATQNYNEQKYKDAIAALLMNKQKLKMPAINIDDTGLFLEGKGIKKHFFRVVGKSKDFESIAGKGCDTLLDHYFGYAEEKGKPYEQTGCRERIKHNETDLFIRPKFDYIEQANVIAKLFEFEIPVNLDDISGSLKIAYSRIK
jgi:hypothetical protein